jgi:hypothetical protein
MPAAPGVTDLPARSQVDRPTGETSRRTATTTAVQASVALEPSAETSPRARTATAHGDETMRARPVSPTTRAVRHARAGAPSKAKTRRDAPPAAPVGMNAMIPPPHEEPAVTAPAAEAPSAMAPALSVAGAVVSGVGRVRALALVLPVRGAVVSGVGRVRALALVLPVRGAVVSGVGRVRALAPALTAGKRPALHAAKAQVRSVRARRPEVARSAATTLVADAGRAAGPRAGPLRAESADSPIAAAADLPSAMAVAPQTAVAGRSSAAAGRRRSHGRGETLTRPSPMM